MASSTLSASERMKPTEKKTVAARSVSVRSNVEALRLLIFADAIQPLFCLPIQDRDLLTLGSGHPHYVLISTPDQRHCFRQGVILIFTNTID